MAYKRIGLWCCLVFFLFLLTPRCYGQSSTGLLREYLESQFDTIDNKWKNSYLERRGYDERGRIITNSGYVWAPAKSNWQISQELEYKYNYKDERIFSHEDYFNTATGKIMWQSEINYENNLSIFQKRISYDSVIGEYYNSTDTWKYNKNGQLLEWKSEYSDRKNNQTGTSIESYAYNDNGCRTGTSNEYSGVNNGSEYYYWDSSGVYVDSKCRMLHTNIFYKGSQGSYPVFSRSITFDIEYDTHGFPVKETIYNNFSTVPVNEGEISEVITYTNNENGMPLKTFSANNYGPPNQIIQEYDSMGRETFRESQQYDSSANQWLTNLRLIQHYNEYNDLIYLLDEEGYDKTTGHFYYAGDAAWIYNEKHFLEKVIGHSWGFNWQTNSYDDISNVYEFNDRCDGKTGYSEYRVQEGGGPEITMEKSVYNYFDIAYCETVTEKNQSITLFPNPAKNYINIYSNIPMESSDIRIIAMNGQVLFTKTVLNSNYISLDLNGISPGVYILKINSEHNNYISRFIKSD